MSVTLDLHLDSFSFLMIFSKSILLSFYWFGSFNSLSLLSLFANDYYLVSLFDIADNLSRIFWSNLLLFLFCSVVFIAFWLGSFLLLFLVFMSLSVCFLNISWNSFNSSAWTCKFSNLFLLTLCYVLIWLKSFVFRPICFKLPIVLVEESSIFCVSLVNFTEESFSIFFKSNTSREYILSLLSLVTDAVLELGFDE